MSSQSAPREIDINCDMGESFGAWRMGHDEEAMPFISSANIACGAHAGDPSVMEHTLILASRHGVAVGAHPGYPDLPGFGRRVLDMSPDDLWLSILSQIGALNAIARSCGVDLHHVKAHGALYNRAAISADIAEPIVRAVKSFSRDLPVYCPPGSVMAQVAADQGLAVVPEGFADRLYEPSGLLVDRALQDSVLKNPESVANQALELAGGRLIARDGTILSLDVKTICVHGDNPNLLSILPAVRRRLEAAGYLISRTGRDPDEV
jgi:UPF0271 protein